MSHVSILASYLLYQAILYKWFVIPTGLWIIWRLWMFTLKALIWPQLPKELPYSIPILGNYAWDKPAKFHDSDIYLSLSAHCHLHGNYCLRTHEIFTIQVLGRKLYIITDPQHVVKAYKDSQSLGFDGHLNDLLISFGFSNEALKNAWHKPEPGDDSYIPNNPINPTQINFIHHTEEHFKKQLLFGPRMNILGDVFIQSLYDSLLWSKLGFCTSSIHGTVKHVSLYSLCRRIIVDAATRSLFGDHLHQIDPNVVDYMLRFNDYAWQIFFRFPHYLSGGVNEPRKHLINTIKTFLSLPDEERSQQAWVIKMVMANADITGIDLESKASVLLMIYWAANSNEYNITFWVLSYLLYDDNLKISIIQETEAAWKDGNLDIEYLCANCPHLEAAFYEALRLNGGAMVSRIVMKETSIGEKVLQPGNAILMPSRQLHTNEDVWGHSCRSFDATRFLKQKSLTRHPSYRPFGGGATYCPGRVLAKHQVYGMIAILFHRMDLKLVLNDKGEKPKFPILNDTTPGLGITGPLKGMDLELQVWER